jgi:hypothetical protein
VDARLQGGGGPSQNLLESCSVKFFITKTKKQLSKNTDVTKACKYNCI